LVIDRAFPDDTLNKRMIESGRADLAYAPVEDRGAAPARAAHARFHALAETHLSFIWRSLRRLGVPDAGVDDAVQKVFLIALRRLDDIQEGHERAFLFATAMHVAADVRRVLARTRTRERSDDDALDAAVDSAPTPDQAVDQKRARALLDEVLDAMDDDLRVVFVLFEIEGLTSPEIASLLGIPLGTAASRLRRSREHFHTIAKRVRTSVSRGGGDP
jgi:RNA polymerase sigma-70 factor (ECF subfamily)